MKLRFTGAFIFLHLFILQIQAQTINNQPVVSLEGELKQPSKISVDLMKGYKRSSVMLLEHDGKKHKYGGVGIMELLSRAGVTTGKELRGENLSKYLLVKCADGYKAVFSLAELDSSFNNRVIILADEMDGAPIPPALGPFRLVVPDEKKAARSCRQVVALFVRSAKE